METIQVKLGSRSYDIVFAQGFQALADYLKAILIGKKILIVSDTNVAPLYLETVIDCIASAGFLASSFVFEAGEKSKKMDTILEIYRAALDAGLDRSSAIIALGGGVAGDMAGFAAATYMRGIRYVQLPTSLVAQVDSSVGGKTGIDFLSYKNIVGAFYQPQLVYINTKTLLTLPTRELSAGLAEVVKYGVIYDQAFFALLEQQMGDVLQLKEPILTEVIKRCCEIKADVVAQDETEAGLRAILNFGHTIGHGVEAASSFSLLHGECVGLGMVAAAVIAKEKDICNCVARLEQLLQTCGLPVKTNTVVSDAVKRAMQKDKKKTDGKLSFILPVSIGEVLQTKEVTAKEVDAALDYIIEEL